MREHRQDPGPGVCYAFERRASGVQVTRAERRGRSVHLETSAPVSASVLSRIETDVAGGRAWSVAAVPGHQTVIRRVTAPFASITKARKVLPSLLDIKLPFPIEECVVEWPEVCRNHEGRVEALGVAIRNPNLVSQLAAWRADGADPVALESLPVAVWSETVHRHPPEPAAHRVVVWLGDHETEWMIGREGRLLHTLSVRAGPGPDLAASAERIAARALPFLKTSLGPVDPSGVEWLWCGPCANNKDWPSAVAGALHLSPGHGKCLAESGSVLSAGLCRRILLESTPGASLRGGEQIHSAVGARRLREGRRVAFSVGLAALVVIGLHAIWHASQTRVLRSVEARIAERAGELAGGARVPRGQELLVIDRLLAESAPASEAFAAMTGPSAAPVLQRLLDTVQEQGTVLDLIALRPESALLQGRALAWADPEALARMLRDAGYSEPTLERNDLGSDQGVSFTLRVQP
ncbi:MAG TPA: hypothetical protein PKE55_03050 [Kiritimatiellia bacterium]|nr:hypothetical protein [Kiritimatiellia bacterium]